MEVITKFKFSGYIGQAVGRTEMMALEMEMLTAKPEYSPQGPNSQTGDNQLYKCPLTSAHVHRYIHMHTSTCMIKEQVHGKGLTLSSG